MINKIKPSPSCKFIAVKDSAGMLQNAVCYVSLSYVNRGLGCKMITRKRNSISKYIYCIKRLCTLIRCTDCTAWRCIFNSGDIRCSLHIHCFNNTYNTFINCIHIHYFQYTTLSQSFFSNPTEIISNPKNEQLQNLVVQTRGPLSLFAVKVQEQRDCADKIQDRSEARGSLAPFASL